MAFYPLFHVVSTQPGESPSLFGGFESRQNFMITAQQMRVQPTFRRIDPFQEQQLLTEESGTSLKSNQKNAMTISILPFQQGKFAWVRIRRHWRLIVMMNLLHHNRFSFAMVIAEPHVHRTTRFF